ncbi:MAG TPA: hypothetical protein VK178_19055 [Opitutaceae bacterium]|nr:hypothetical protein [Opitutaceae bacterium]
MKTIAFFTNPIEAEMACEFLRAQGFVTELTNLAAQSAVLGAGNPLSELELRLPDETAAEGARCLRDWQRATDTDGSAEPEPRAPRYVGYDATDWNARERRVERAYRCTILGPLFPVPFVTWYGMYCLVVALRSGETLRFELRRKLRIAAVVGSIFTVVWLVLTVIVFSTWWHALRG